MIPVGDSLRSRTFPLVNYTIIAVNFLVWFYELVLQSQAAPRAWQLIGMRTELDRWVLEWGVIPCRITASCPVQFDRVVDTLGRQPDWLDLITSQFIHGSWSHILGNMLFLWIFGDNIEDAMGHVRYLLFYLLGGVIAGLAQVASDPSGTIPSVGASGAIAAVLGAYFVTYPAASVQVLIPVWFIPFFTRIPAFVMMLFWFLSQLISVGVVAQARGGQAGIAYWAHIGGFLAGMVLVWFFRGHRRSLDTDRLYERYRWRLRDDW